MRINVYIVEPRYELIWDRPSTMTHARRYFCIHSHSRLMETHHPSVTGIGHYGIVCNPTWCAHVSHLFRTEYLLDLIINIISNLLIIYLLISFIKKASKVHITARRSGQVYAQCINNHNVVAGNSVRSCVWAVSGGSDAIGLLSKGLIGIIG
jgi:hypothetical protein